MTGQEGYVYLPRVEDSRLHGVLQRSGGVLIEGPKGCGKSATARQIAGSLVQVDTDLNLDMQLSTVPDLALEGDTPRVFDEWQENRSCGTWCGMRLTVGKRLGSSFLLGRLRQWRNNPGTRVRGA